MGALRKALHYIDNISNWTGRIASFLVWPMFLVIVYDVIVRDIWHAPTTWAMELSTFIFTAMWLLGAAYSVLTDANVNMDLVYVRQSPRVKAILDVVSAPFFFIFAVVLVWKGGLVAWNATNALQTSPTIWGPALYPIKWFIPLGCFLMLLQALAGFIRNLIKVIGREKALCLSFSLLYYFLVSCYSFCSPGFLSPLP